MTGEKRTVGIFTIPQEFPCGEESSCCGPVGCGGGRKCTKEAIGPYAIPPGFLKQFVPAFYAVCSGSSVNADLVRGNEIEAK